MLGLSQANLSRSGTDALDEAGNPWELKSTSKGGVWTARDVGADALQRWRRKYWAFVCGANLKGFGFRPEHVVLCHPAHLEPWFPGIEARFAGDVALLDRVSAALLAIAHVAAEVPRIQVLVKRGLTLNNPKSSWALIIAAGTSHAIDDAIPRRRAFTATHPLS